MTRSFGQILLGVGTVVVHSSDKSASSLEIINIKAPKQVKELIHQLVEECKARRRFRFGEFEAVGDEGDEK